MSVLGNDFAILLVEDDTRLQASLRDALLDAGFRTTAVSSLSEARLALAQNVDLLLLDLGLPDGNGLDLCMEARERNPLLPIIILTARDEIEQRVQGLDAGADDYLVKPFHLQEFLARVRSLLRRTTLEESQERRSVHEIWADPSNRKAGKGDAHFDLKPKEFDLLFFFLGHPDRTWTRPQLLAKVWGDASAVGERSVDLHVRRLRAQIEENPNNPIYLETVWGIGYQFVNPVQ